MTFDGKLDGDISSDGALHLGDNAVVKGNINVHTVIVRGKVNGNVTANLVLNNAGHVVHPNFTATYTVNANGTGTISWVSFGTPRRRTFVIGDGGNQVKWVADDVPSTGGVVGGTMVKQ